VREARLRDAVRSNFRILELISIGKLRMTDSSFKLSSCLHNCAAGWRLSEVAQGKWPGAWRSKRRFSPVNAQTRDDLRQAIGSAIELRCTVVQGD